MSGPCAECGHSKADHETWLGKACAGLVMGSDACWCHGYRPETPGERHAREAREERWFLEDLGAW